MKKVLIIIVNIFLFLGMLLTLNYYAEKYQFYLVGYVNDKMPYQVKYSEEEIQKYDAEPFPYGFKFLEWNEENHKKFCGEERISFGQEYKNQKPVVIIGCSYAYGHGIKKESSFPYILSKIIKRPVYSFSKCGNSPIQSFNEMSDYIEHHPEIKNTEYVIYLYMYDHINRMLKYTEFKQMMDINNLREGKKNIIPDFFLFDYIQTSLKIRMLLYGRNAKEKSALYMKNFIINLNYMIKSILPHSKFVVIVYDEKILKGGINNNIPYVSNILNSEIWYDLPDEITVVKTKDIMGFKFNNNYKIKEDYAGIHPNERVWQEFTPKFAEKYIN